MISYDNFINTIKNNRVYINYSRMWPYVKPVWFRALCSMLICIPIGSLDAVIALALKPYMDLVMVENPLPRLGIFRLVLWLLLLFKAG